MGMAFEVIGGRVTNPGATLTALTANTGNSFTVRSFPFGSPAYIDEAWAQEATTGQFRIRSNRLHDNSQGIRMQVSATASGLLPYYAAQALYPQDVLTVELSGGGAETDAGFFLAYYTDLPGVSARLATWDQISPRIVNLMGVLEQVTSGATLSDWSGSQAFNADQDTFKRNVDYAILGYTLDATCGAIRITGSDTGNLGVGGPGNLRPEVTANWFADLSVRTGRPFIPVFNAANVGAMTFDISHTANAATFNVTVLCAELSGGAGGLL